jgi:hypothetical protein
MREHEDGVVREPPRLELLPHLPVRHHEPEVGDAETRAEPVQNQLANHGEAKRSRLI